ncbi:MAG: hypothetical protein C4582_04705 [Desulfobacteraceae bacterium]|nr:MAG: hypothetical protein C4582_04705 [Desulfobacteraceae bacterium]
MEGPVVEMEIICEKCGVKLTVPDGKIPKGGHIQGECPRCKARITLAPQKAEDHDPLPDDFFYEEGVRLALLLDSDRDSLFKTKDIAEKMGFKAISPAGAEEALFELRSHHFDLVVLSDGFESRPLTQSAIMEYLNRLPMSFRRRMLVAIVGQRFKTGDAMEAFSLSSDLVVGKGDLDRFADIIKHGMAEKDRIYRAFKEIMAELGRE